MTDVSSPLGIDGKGRQVARVMREHILRVYHMFHRNTGGDLIAGIVCATIISANLSHMQTGTETDDAFGDTLPPDELRRPISIQALARATLLPRETVRRTVVRLIEAGICVRTPKGIFVPTHVIAAMDNVSTLEVEQEFRRLLVNLRRIGVDLETASI
jgi:DNA-binding transcriptional regulator YhcF (GntR family)